MTENVISFSHNYGITDSAIINHVLQQNLVRSGLCELLLTENFSSTKQGKKETNELWDK